MKKYIHLPLLLTVMLSFSSCNQTLMAIGHAVGNVLALPFEALGDLGNYIAGNTYSNMKERTQNAHTARAASVAAGSGVGCYNNVDASTGAAGELAGTLVRVRDTFCSCKAWGTCDKGNCACDQLCPDNFDILDRGGQEIVTSSANSLIFRNRAEDFAGVHDMTNGFCWGISSLEQKVNRMGFFQPPPTSKPSPGDSESARRTRLAIYRSIINEMENNRPANIPGFANLREFSSDPEVRDILMDRAGHIWADSAMSPQGIGIIASSTPIRNPGAQSLADDLEYRVRNHQAPTIVFNQEGDAAYAHVVQVTDVRRDASGNRYLCIRDPNYDAADQTNCESKMEINSEGNIHYNQWGDAKLGQVEITHNEDSDTVSQVHALRERCLREKDCDD